MHGEVMIQGMEGLSEAMAQGLGAAKQGLSSPGAIEAAADSALPNPKGKPRPAKKRTKGRGR